MLTKCSLKIAEYHFELQRYTILNIQIVIIDPNFVQAQNNFWPQDRVFRNLCSTNANVKHLMQKILTMPVKQSCKL